MKPILVLVNHCADGYDLSNYKHVPTLDDAKKLAHLWLLELQNEENKEEAEEDKTEMIVCTAENSPLEELDGVCALGGKGDDGGEGIRVHIVKDDDMTRKRLTQKLWNGGQSCHYEALWEIGGQKAKVSIKRDSHDFQCYARVSLFNKNEWHVAATIPWPSMSSLMVDAYQREVVAERFAEDEERLLIELEMVLT